jgi:hypothetical protein
VLSEALPAGFRPKWSKDHHLVELYWKFEVSAFVILKPPAFSVPDFLLQNIFAAIADSL